MNGLLSDRPSGRRCVSTVKLFCIAKQFAEAEFISPEQLKEPRQPKKKDTPFGVSFFFGTAEGIRTPDLLVRSQSLYPTELQPHTVKRNTEAFPLTA